jgi:hypothetical protein
MNTFAAYTTGIRNSPARYAPFRAGAVSQNIKEYKQEAHNTIHNTINTTNFIQKVHEEEHVVVGVVLLLDVQLEAMRNVLQFLAFCAYQCETNTTRRLTHAADEALRFVVGFNCLELITQLAERIDNETLVV